MKILIVNGSPRGKNSCTMRMVAPLSEGMEEAGAQVKLLYLAELNPGHCRGCFSCWFKTPGKCVIEDGYNEAMSSCEGAELVVFAAPLYHFHMPGLMKNFLDRTITASEPWIIPDDKRDGISTHPVARRNTINSIMLVSPCGFPEVKHFKPYSDWFKAYAKIAGLKWTGEILRPMGELLRSEEMQPHLSGYFADLRDAGMEVVREGALRHETEIKLQRDLLKGGSEEFRALANNRFAKLLGHKQPEK
ncbi:MAG: flavodoxin family protein [Elusimicrobiales bacterium]|nr:flavodoxin family protein [Elusimicrobiales bacterium]